jgi:hypothetical protein
MFPDWRKYDLETDAVLDAADERGFYMNIIRTEDYDDVSVEESVLDALKEGEYELYIVINYSGDEQYLTDLASEYGIIEIYFYYF